jgi:hypothetical protein
VRQEFVNFFHGADDDEDGVFSETDISRMFALQYIMTLLVTLDNEKYFARNEKLKSYIEGYNESFHRAIPLQNLLLNVIRFISALNIRRESRWYKKANLFSLIAELGKVNLTIIDRESFGHLLTNFDYRATLQEISFGGEESHITYDEKRYLDYAREAVNQKAAREYRGEFIRTIIDTCSASTASLFELLPVVADGAA